jgi:hypothetical protein
LNLKRLGLLGLLFATGVVASLALISVAQATKIDPGDFDAPILIHFETAPNGLVGDFYSDFGVSFAQLGAGPSFNTGTGNGISRVACNFVGGPPVIPPGPPQIPPPPRPASELLFDSDINRAGFFITADSNSTTTVTAYKDGSQVGSEAYATGGQGAGGSFIGVEFSSAFDRLVISIQATGGYGGGFCIDDLRFEGKDTEPTTEPTREPTPEPTRPPATEPTKGPPPQATATPTPDIIVIRPPSTGDGGIK